MKSIGSDGPGFVRGSPPIYGLQDEVGKFIRQRMALRNFLLGFLFASLQALASSDDVILRAQRSAFIPSLSVSYSYRQDRPQVLFAGLTWEFDESLLGDRMLAAIQIKRIEREARFIKATLADDR